MKQLFALLLLLGLSSQALAYPPPGAMTDTKLGFYCVGRHAEEESNRIFFHIILDTATYDKTNKTVKAIVLERVQPGGPYAYVDFSAFYVSESDYNPQFYVRNRNFQFGEYQMNLEVYPLARNMIGYAFMELYKDGKLMPGTCERADYYDGVWE